MDIFVPLVPDSSLVIPVKGAHNWEDSAATVDLDRAGTELDNTARLKATADTQERIARQMLAENGAALAAINATTGMERIVVPASATPTPSLLKLSPTGRWIVYLSTAGAEAGLASTTADRQIRLLTTSLHPTRRAGFALSAISWHPSRDVLFWIEGHQLWTLDVSERNTQPRRVAPELTDVTVGPLMFTADGRFVVVGVNPFDVDDFRDPLPRALAVIPILGGATRVLQLPAALHAQALAPQRGATMWEPDPDTIMVVAQDSRTTERAIVRLHLGTGNHQVVWRGLADVRLAGAAPDHKFAIGTLEDINTPRNVYEFSPGLSPTQRITDVEPRLTNMSFGPVESFSTVVPMYDGSSQQRTTTILLPLGKRRGDRLPTVVCQYPGLSLSTTAGSSFGGGTSCGIPLGLITTRGYAVLLVDAPITPLGTTGDPAKEMADVVTAQVHSAAALGYVDIHRVAVIGGSAGGYSAAAILTHTHLFRAGIAIAGFYDLGGWNTRTVIHQRLPSHVSLDSQRYLVNSPLYRSDQIRTPLLLIHGEKDAVPASEARKLFDALKGLDRTAQLAIYRGEGHVISNWSLVNAMDASRRIVEFLARHLRPIADGSTLRALPPPDGTRQRKN